MAASDILNKNCIFLLINTLKVLFLCCLMGYVKSASTGGKNEEQSMLHVTYHYGVVIDAGSSGSRIHVYKWPPKTHENKLPNITKLYSNKTEPGISSFKDNINGLDNYIKMLVSMSEDHVPSHLHNQTYIYVMATAGE